VACTSQGIVYACGKNDYGQLGVDGATNLKNFSKIILPAEMDNIAQVCCGYYHTLVLSSSGVVGGFGRNDYGQVIIIIYPIAFIPSIFLSMLLVSSVLDMLSQKSINV
jgi:alpha-tubulin suppressor-like RCC1 family protein